MPTIDQPVVLEGATFTLTPRDTVAETRSVYSGAEERLDFGGEWWELTIQTPLLDWDSAAELDSWTDRLRDADAIARLSLLGLAPKRGTTTATTMTFSANALAGARSFGISGLGASATLGAGSFLSVADRLHRLRVGAVADGSGACTIEVFPRLRAPATLGSTIQIATGVRGLWRLQGRPAHSWDAQRGNSILSGKTLTFVEAL